MKSSPRPPHELDPSGVLTPTEYTAAVNLWQTIRDANGADLVNCLLDPATNARLVCLTFPVMQIVELISAVGVQSIRARFVALRDEKNRPHFSVVMFAVGANDTVLSSYYLAERYWKPKPSAAPVRLAPLRVNRNAPKHALPKALADYWVVNWADAKRYPTNSALFTSVGQPMRGYNFAVSDLMDPLRGLNDFNSQVLAMVLGLHTVLHFDGTVDAPVATLGLMLQMASLSDKDEATGDDEIFDVGMPSPPAL